MTCFPMMSASLAPVDASDVTSQLRRVRAFSIVSAVVKVLEITTTCAADAHRKDGAAKEGRERKQQ